MQTLLGRLIILVADYDEALEFYEEVMGCIVLHDEETANGERYLHIGFQEEGPGFWLIQAQNEEQQEQIGKQTAGQPIAVLYTDDFEDFHQRLLDYEAEVTRGPVQDPNFTYLHFLDLYGNEFVLVNLTPPSAQ